MGVFNNSSESPRFSSASTSQRTSQAQSSGSFISTSRRSHQLPVDDRENTRASQIPMRSSVNGYIGFDQGVDREGEDWRKVLRGAHHDTSGRNASRQSAKEQEQEHEHYRNGAPTGTRERSERFEHGFEPSRYRNRDTSSPRRAESTSRVGEAEVDQAAFVSRPPRRESLLMPSGHQPSSPTSRLAPSRPYAVASPSSNALSSFYDPNLPISNPNSPLTQSTPAYPTSSPAVAVNSPLAALATSASARPPSDYSIKSSPSSKSNFFDPSSPILAPSLFNDNRGRSTPPRNGSLSPRVDKDLPSPVVPSKAAFESHSRVIHNHHSPTMGTSSNSSVLANQSGQSSPSRIGKGVRNGRSIESSPTRRAPPSNPTTPILVNPSTLQRSNSNKALPELTPEMLGQEFKFEPLERRTSPHPQPQTSPRAQALAAARARDQFATTSSSTSSESEETSSSWLHRTRRGLSSLELALTENQETIFRRVLAFMNYGDFCSLRSTCHTLRRLVERDSIRELALQRFLGPWGYRSLSIALNHPTSSEPITLSLKDLDAFLISTEIPIEQYSRFAKDYTTDRLHPNTLRVIRASTRAWNRVVLRLRWQSSPRSGLHFEPYAFEGQVLNQNLANVFKSGRTPTLRTWVPLNGSNSWMSDDEVVECEREVWRSGVWAQLRKGDVVNNTAVAPFGNLGKLIFDGKFLRDFEYKFDVVGHLPSWLDMLAFSPQYYHNVVASSTSSPVFYLCLHAYLDQARQTVTLKEDKIQVSSPQGSYTVKRFMHRGSIKIRPSDPIFMSSNSSISEYVHPDWIGTIVLEFEGSAEHYESGLRKVARKEPTPWRILREKSRPGKLYIRPVLDGEAV